MYRVHQLRPWDTQRILDYTGRTQTATQQELRVYSILERRQSVGSATLAHYSDLQQLPNVCLHSQKYEDVMENFDVEECSLLTILAQGKRSVAD
jgi:hypothetical protein